MQASVC
ncbi:uncharacterized protein FFM5_15332 [Fusarium fujikuroi]|nr:uncharacterized protein FFM5_15332 [Fusarium fujikuroi]